MGHHVFRDTRLRSSSSTEAGANPGYRSQYSDDDEDDVDPLHRHNLLPDNIRVAERLVVSDPLSGDDSQGYYVYRQEAYPGGISEEYVLGPDSSSKGKSQDKKAQEDTAVYKETSALPPSPDNGWINFHDHPCSVFVIKHKRL
ncbi:hypothetical protein CIHG_02577 [Coccidioides immitis H538.4]|uniref:Uncharacterized protein n=1 Tax=Coccidioides immitis H538.4 TaxID=396776 RepID=A0A0J8UC59_COCIT|nr:hypothetical protein CIHG_02577 [Coccidioides immitis H538.4]